MPRPGTLAWRLLGAHDLSGAGNPPGKKWRPGLQAALMQELHRGVQRGSPEAVRKAIAGSVEGYGCLGDHLPPVRPDGRRQPQSLPPGA